MSYRANGVHIRPQSPAHETGAELFGKVMGKSVF